MTMVRIIGLLWLFLFGYWTAFAQAERAPKAECPTAEVSGPAGVVAPGETATFVVELKGKVPDVVTFEWVVSRGKILKGNGTNTIQVQMDLDTVTATVDIGGLPKGCSLSVSESVIYCTPHAPVLLDQYSIQVSLVAVGRLLTVAEELTNNPTNQLYIIEYFPRGTSESTIANKFKRMTDLLVKRGKLDRARITYVTDFADHPFTRIYRIPPGAENPAP